MQTETNTKEVINLTAIDTCNHAFKMSDGLVITRLSLFQKEILDKNSILFNELLATADLKYKSNSVGLTAIELALMACKGWSSFIRCNEIKQILYKMIDQHIELSETTISELIKFKQFKNIVLVYTYSPHISINELNRIIKDENTINFLDIRYSILTSDTLEELCSKIDNIDEIFKKSVLNYSFINFAIERTKKVRNNNEIIECLLKLHIKYRVSVSVETVTELLQYDSPIKELARFISETIASTKTVNMQITNGPVGIANNTTVNKSDNTDDIANLKLQIISNSTIQSLTYQMNEYYKHYNKEKQEHDNLKVTHTELTEKVNKYESKLKEIETFILSKN